MKLIDLTPKILSCGWQACPAIFKTPNDSYILIGKKAPQGLEALAGRIGPDEVAIEIPSELLANLSGLKSR